MRLTHQSPRKIGFSVPVYTPLEYLAAPRFVHRRLHLLCNIFGAKLTLKCREHVPHAVEANFSPRDLLITTQDQTLLSLLSFRGHISNLIPLRTDHHDHIGNPTDTPLSGLMLRQSWYMLVHLHQISIIEVSTLEGWESKNLIPIMKIVL